MKRHNRIIATLAVIVVTLTVLLSVLFVSTESVHKCTGDECPICSELHICWQIIDTSVSAIVYIAAAIIIIYLIITKVKNNEIITKTLINLKVELQN